MKRTSIFTVLLFLVSWSSFAAPNAIPSTVRYYSTSGGENYTSEKPAEVSSLWIKIGEHKEYRDIFREGVRVMQSPGYVQRFNEMQRKIDEAIAKTKYFKSKHSEIRRLKTYRQYLGAGENRNFGDVRIFMVSGISSIHGGYFLEMREPSHFREYSYLGFENLLRYSLEYIAKREAELVEIADQKAFNAEFGVNVNHSGRGHVEKSVLDHQELINQASAQET